MTPVALPANDTASGSPGAGQTTGSSPDRTSGVEPGTPPKVQLIIPATSRFLRLARLTAAGLAGDLGYPIDAIEDLRIAVDELCAAIIEDTTAPAELELTYREINGGLSGGGTGRAQSAKPPHPPTGARER